MAKVSHKGRRSKGSNAEREVAAILSDYFGEDIKRVLLSGVRGEGDVEVPRLHVEVKRQERTMLGKWFREEMPKALKRGLPFALIHRRSREEWMVTMTLEHWMEIARDGI
jgi:hypothetical protein